MRLRHLRGAALLASSLLIQPSASQSLPDWAAPSQAAQDPSPPGFPSTPDREAPPGFPSTPGTGAPPGFAGRPGAGPQPPYFPSEPTSVPIDGGLAWLALAGAAYAAKTLRTR